MTALYLRGVILPEGEERELWIDDGLVHDTPIPGAETLATGCWVIPGLVDAHCHVGIGPAGPVPHEVQRAQAEADLAAGTMLIRDAGSPADNSWIHQAGDLPRLIRAGQHVARPKRYIRCLGVEVEPDQLVVQVRHEARSGDGWVKLVGDWIDRSLGDLAPLWPAEVAAEAIAAAHEEGARVTAHCFAEQAVHELVEAGIDCIEHGTGLSAEGMAAMAQRGTALVPTMINLDNFPMYAAPAEEKFPTYFAHMHDLHRRRHQTIRAAIEAGVSVYTGTDAGTVVAHGRICDEIEAIARIAGPDYALAASSWNARAWLGADVLDPGSSADLLVLDADPRVDLTALRRPSALVLRGDRIA